jgi:peptidoglycan/xylan/chitin deacetylase (PgdA/CDA1 family)
VRTLAVGTAAAAAAWCAPTPAPVSPAVAALFGIELRLRGPLGVALTFDDGPHPEATSATLELLRAAGAKATFFLVGEQIERFPALAAEIAAEGHELAVHGYRHRLLLRRPPRALARDLTRCAELVAVAAGREPRCYRPPYGVFSSVGLALARRHGWTPLLWSRWGRDWARSATPQSIARLATRDLSAGDVILLHDADHYSVEGSWRATVAALPRILEKVEAIGARCVTATP